MEKKPVTLTPLRGSATVDYPIAMARLTQYISEKVEKGLPLTRREIAFFKLLKETLVDLHKMKHGEKKINVNVGYQDIQEMMFGKKE